MAQHEAWQVGGNAAELYQRYLVPAIASLWAADLIDRAAPRPGERVLKDRALDRPIIAQAPSARWGPLVRGSPAPPDPLLAQRKAADNANRD
jgi:hypothetical protein